MSLAEGTAVGRTLTLGRGLMVPPEIDSKDDRLGESPGATLMAFEQEKDGECIFFLWG